MFFTAAKTRYHLIWVLLTSMIVLLDQWTKWLAVKYLQIKSIYVLPGLNFTLVYNRGAAFSFLSQAGGWQVWFFLVLSSVVSMVLIYMLAMKKDKFTNPFCYYSFILILSGALGNLIDRFSYGYVIDFIDVYYKTHHWPIFNLADSAITCGAILFFYGSYKENKNAH